MNKKGQATRILIKKNASALFAAKGFKVITMKDICEATGLSRGGLYCHYASTSEIFAEIMHDMLERQKYAFNSKIENHISAIKILDDILKQYESEMLDSDSSLSIAIYEYFSMEEHNCQGNAIYKQYLLSSTMWKDLIQYGINRKEFNQVDVSAVFDLIVFSYQGVRMYSKLMPIDKKIPQNIIQEIRKILVK